jgi:hypothetical protein
MAEGCDHPSRVSRARHNASALRFLLAAALAILFFAVAQPARAGYAIQPADGSTVATGDPTYLVYLDNNDSLATVYVATTNAMSSTGVPVNRLGSCTPSTPFGEQYKLTCRVGVYSGSSTRKLAPGTYYWWMTYTHKDIDHPLGTRQMSGPFQFSVIAPPEPQVSLLGPVSGATVQTSPTFRLSLPESVTATVYVSSSGSWNNSGLPNGTTLGQCAITSSTAGTYSCSDPAATRSMTGGRTYYWWAVVTTADGGSWTFGPETFLYKPSSTGGGGGAGGTARVHTRADAPYLPSVTRWTGASAKHKVLSAATYRFTKEVGHPRLLSIACWSDRDWPGVSLNDDPLSSTLGFFSPLQPRWIHLSPQICRSLQTLLTSRPKYPNRLIADGVDTLTHEMIHAAFGVKNEALTECYSMQVTELMALDLKVPFTYAKRLGRLTLANYLDLPPKYIDRNRCSESGQWDLFPEEPSPPWHDFPV